MAFDPPYVDVAREFIGLNPSYHFKPMKGNTERERKFRPPCATGNVVALPNNSDYSLSQGASTIEALLSNLQAHGIWFDDGREIVIPNNYVLASLNLDTVEETVPTAQFYNNGWQCRLRKPLFVHNGKDGFDIGLTMRQIDANMKTFQSGLTDGNYRVELEEVVKHHPSSFFRSFRSAVDGMPDFTNSIEDRNLRVSDICLTSRTGFYMVMKDPQSDHHVLLHATYDASRFTTSHADVFTGQMRLEFEIEAKGIIGENTPEMTSDEQDTIVNRVFAVIQRQATELGMTEITLSKLEESLASVKAHYENMQNRDFSGLRKHLQNNSIQHTVNGAPSLSHLYALVNGRRVPEIMQELRDDGINARFCQRAAEMPDPRTMLTLNTISRRTLAVA